MFLYFFLLYILIFEIIRRGITFGQVIVIEVYNLFLKYQMLYVDIFLL